LTAAAIAGPDALAQAGLALDLEPSPGQGSSAGSPGSQPGDPSSPGEGQGPSVGQGEGQGQGEGSGQGQDQGQGQGQGQGQAQGQGPAQRPAPGGSSSQAGTGGSSRGGNSQANEPGPQAALQLHPGPASGEGQTGTSQVDAQLRARGLASEPWFARLPPELRQAIQAKTTRRAPRGYEERMRRYFENID
jgi:hypothetical protein